MIFNILAIICGAMVVGILITFVFAIASGNTSGTLIGIIITMGVIFGVCVLIILGGVIAVGMKCPSPRPRPYTETCISVMGAEAQCTRVYQGVERR